MDPYAGRLLRYKVEYRVAGWYGTLSWSDFTVASDDVRGSRVYTIEGLNPNTRYVVRVSASWGRLDVPVWSAPSSEIVEDTFATEEQEAEYRRKKEEERAARAEKSAESAMRRKSSSATPPRGAAGPAEAAAAEGAETGEVGGGSNEAGGAPEETGQTEEGDGK